ncbi:MAG: type II toxin-antitoxin system VapC family toxin [Verrucomicrobia bacterium]|nr:type II toxin-antitoxin system VapC family toxin [Verrucomicrobiota bacterium]
MKFIADANLLSEPTKPEPSPQVLEWLRRNEEQLAVTPIILGELEYGILLLPTSKRKKQLEVWFEKIRSTAHCLDFDSKAASSWAHLLAHLKSQGHAMPIKDSLIAASAIAHNLTVATRNTRDFKNTKVPLLNPFENN